MERRRHRRWREWFKELPEVQELRRQIKARQKYRQRHPFSGQHPGLRGLLRMHCIVAGIQQGGLPPKARRYTIAVFTWMYGTYILEVPVKQGKMSVDPLHLLANRYKWLGVRLCWNWRAPSTD